MNAAAAAVRLQAKRSIVAEFGSEDCRFFGLLLRYVAQLNERHDRLFRGFVEREARYAYLLRSGLGFRANRS